MWSAVRTKVGLAAVGGALLLTGVGLGAGVATGAIGVQPASDQTGVTTPASTSTSSAPTTTPAPAAVVQSAAPTSAATVAAVTTSDPAPTTSAQQAMTVAPGVTPIDPNDLARGGHDADGNYVPAVGNPGAGGPVVAPAPVLPSAPKLPGEPGYTPPPAG